MKLEVRCCCDVMKLIGWIPLPYQERDLPRSIRLPLLENMPEGPIPQVAVRLGVIDLFVEHFAYGKVARSRAFKADGIPIETLRRIQGFIEATPKNIAIEIKLKMLELVRDDRRVVEIRVHPSIMMELELIPFLETPVRIGASGCTFDGLPLIPDEEVMSFSVIGVEIGLGIPDLMKRRSQ